MLSYSIFVIYSKTALNVALPQKYTGSCLLCSWWIHRMCC